MLRDMNHNRSESFAAASETYFREGVGECAHPEQDGCRFGVLLPLFVLLIMLHVPVALIWLEVIPFKYRFYTLFFLLAGFAGYAYKRRYSLYELGFRTDNLRLSLYSNLVFCLVGSLGLYLTYNAGWLRPKAGEYLPWIYVFYILFLAPAQEIFFRGILFAEMKRSRIADQRWILLISTFSFCFLHIIYQHPPLLIMALLSGLTWGGLYIKWPNIWGISLSHSLLGAFAILLGVI